MEIKKTCPYGSECETAKDGYIERCILYIPYPMENIETKEIKDIYDCSHNWASSFAREAAATNRGQTAAIESLRNETVKRQNLAIDSMRRLDGN